MINTKYNSSSMVEHLGKDLMLLEKIKRDLEKVEASYRKLIKEYAEVSTEYEPDKRDIAKLLICNNDVIKRINIIKIDREVFHEKMKKTFLCLDEKTLNY